MELLSTTYALGIYSDANICSDGCLLKDIPRRALPTRYTLGMECWYYLDYCGDSTNERNYQEAGWFAQKIKKITKI